MSDHDKVLRARKELQRPTANQGRRENEPIDKRSIQNHQSKTNHSKLENEARRKLELTRIIYYIFGTNNSGKLLTLIPEGELPKIYTLQKDPKTPYIRYQNQI